MILQEAPDRSTELALTLSKGLTEDPTATLQALAGKKMRSSALKALMAAASTGKTVAFELVEHYGKIGVARYECVIDFTKNEVHVTLKDNKHYYEMREFKVVE